MNAPSSKASANVPDQIFDALLERLLSAQVAPDVIERLSGALKNRDFSDKSIRAALFPDTEHD